MFRCLFLLFVNFELVGQESRIVGEKSGKKWRNIKEWWGGGNWKKENYKKRNERVKERVKKMEIKEVVCVWEREGRKEKDVGMMEELVLPIFVGFHVCLFSQMCTAARAILFICTCGMCRYRRSQLGCLVTWAHPFPTSDQCSENDGYPKECNDTLRGITQPSLLPLSPVPRPRSAAIASFCDIICYLIYSSLPTVARFSSGAWYSSLQVQMTLPLTPGSLSSSHWPI